MTVLYFTASGNSLAAAREIGGEILSIPQMIKAGRYEFSDSEVGVVCPIYGFSPPKIVRRFLKKAVIKTDYFFVVGTYGDRYAGFCRIVKRLCRKKKLRLDYVNTLKTVDNALIGYEMAEQIRTLPEKKTEEHLAEIKTDIAERKRYIKPFQKGQRVRNRLVRLLAPVLENGAVTVRMLSADGNCVKCGTCAKVCPAGNIEIADKIRFGKKCASCLSCIHNCPIKAIHFKGEKSGERYRNAGVSLDDIIAANNRT